MHGACLNTISFKERIDMYSCFIPRRTGDVDFVKEHFIATLKSGETPIKDSEAAKIEIDFIDNRCLSPIETGGIL